MLLVATDEDKKAVIDSLEADGTGDPLEIPIFGAYKTSLHRKTGPDGTLRPARGLGPHRRDLRVRAGVRPGDDLAHEGRAARARAAST